jgi:cardiolipin synthase
LDFIFSPPCSPPSTRCCTSATPVPRRIWIAVVWTLPALGPFLYLVLGVNRIRRRAVQLGVHKTFSRDVPENLGEPEHDGAEHLKHIARVVSRVATQPLTAGK